MKKILVIGGGFAGFMAALNAADEGAKNGTEFAITLVSRDEYLTMRPRLYEKHPDTLRVSLRPVLEPVGIALIEGSVADIDTGARSVTIARRNGAEETLGYDALILATGSQLNAPPIPGLAQYAWNIDDYDGAVALDRHLREMVSAPESPGRDTIVILGAGMSGIELAAEMRDRLAVHGGADAAARARVVLVERAPVVGPEFGDDPRPVIEEALRQAEVELRLGVEATAVDEGGVTLSDGERIDAATTVVTVGLRASPLAERIPVVRDELGRLPVDEMLRVVGAPGVYAAGDIARARADGDYLALMSCQHARTMGKYAGYNAAHDLLGLPSRPYSQTDYSTTLDLGRFGAVITTGWDRQLKTYGAEAKERKRMINCERIYPASGSREAILAEARIDEKTGR